MLSLSARGASIKMDGVEGPSLIEANGDAQRLAQSPRVGSDQMNVKKS